MAKYSKKVMGKEVGSAGVYAEPHTMSGKKMTTAKDAVTKPGNGMDKVNMSVAGYTKDNKSPVNKNGEMKIRGTGAATKGVMARGPMA
jgi:formylmethanofuran dehydrogenase subunit C